MSAIGGIYNFDGAPVNDGILIAMGEGLASRGPDGGSHFKSGVVAMVYRAFHTNRESRLETQPLVSKEGHILCWDGRLDNREELIPLLCDELREDHTDVAIVMAAYLKWGMDFVFRILGDFALSLWDPILRTLTLARDIIGPRTLYYHKNERRIIWSTELGLLLDLAGIPLEINDEYVAGFLTNFPEPGLTPYKNVDGVPPAHAVVIKEGKVRVCRFWGIDPNHEIRYKTDAEYEEHFRHLFREAVSCRLRVDGPVWSELSGGMDSSSIVCMANDIIKCGGVQASRLETASRVFDEAAKSDERKYILPVEKKIGKKGLHLREDDYRIAAPWVSEYVPAIPNYVANFAAYYKALNEAMRSTNSRVLFSGLGGGELLLGDGGPFPELADLLVQRKLLQLHRRLRVWSHALEKGYFRVLWQKVIVPLLPHRLQIARTRSFNKTLKFYNQEFVRRMNLRQRMFWPPDVFGFRRPGGRYQSIMFLFAPKRISAGFWQELSDIEFSYPPTHRPLVEFLLAIPVEQKARPNESKSLLRRALRDLLPFELVNRKEGRVSIWAAMVHAVAREEPRIREMFKDARSSAYGYLSAEAILAARDRSGKHLDAQVISLVPFEYWLRSLERRQQAGSCLVSQATLSQPRLTVGAPTAQRQNGQARNHKSASVARS
jgi:asparagine synthase (glutamine-hydrolysing)